MKKYSLPIIIVGILLIIVLTILITIKVVNLTNTDQKETSDAPKGPVKINLNYYKLNDKNHTLKVDDNLTLEFDGEKGNGNYYAYTMEVVLNNKEIYDKKLYIDEETTYKYGYISVNNIDGYYFIEYKNEGAQLPREYVTIISNDGNKIESYDNLGFKYDKDLKEYEVIDYDGMNVYSTKKYKLLENEPYLEVTEFYIDELNKSVKIDNNLTLNFIGEEYTENDNNKYYRYNLDIKLNNKTVDNNLFTDKDNKCIWSSSYAASFKVEKINEYYILTSYIGKQTNGEYIVILKNDGTVVKEFDDVTSEIDYSNESMTINKCDVGVPCDYNNNGIDKVNLKD